MRIVHYETCEVMAASILAESLYNDVGLCPWDSSDDQFLKLHPISDCKLGLRQIVEVLLSICEDRMLKNKILH